MIINYFHIVSVIRLPIKTNPPLVVNPNAVLSGSTADKFFKAIRGRHAQIVNRLGIIYHSQFPQSDLLNVGRQTARAREVVDFLGL